MHRHERNPPLTDEGIDRAIAELLDVRPSGDFVARVRTRIEGEPVAAPGWSSHWIAAAAATASLIVIAVVWWPRPAAHAPEAALAVAEPPIVVVATPSPAAPAVASVPSRTREVASAPSVVVSPTEAAGLRVFMSAIRNGHLDSTVLPPDSGDAGEPMPIVIEPMAVEPLLSAGDLEIGELQ
jgi:hypothetical protein